MPAFALNHMTVASAGFQQMLDLARRLGCVGVECRNDLDGELFDGHSPAKAAEMLRDAGLRLLSLAEIKRFDRLTIADLPGVTKLLDAAAEAGSEAISLIPCNDGEVFDKSALADALELLLPELQQRNLTGFIEPLGFETCGLRLKRLAIDVLESRDWSGHYKLIHDTFHHQISGEPDLYPRHTGLVHLSGVTDQNLDVSQMRDLNRVLVTCDDRLGNITQFTKLLKAGYSGPLSFEVFAPDLHADPTIADQIQQSMNYIDAMLSQEAA